MKERFETFTVLITKISRNIKRIKNQEMAEYGLRSPHVSCLYYLYCENSLTATDLVERCEEDKATISRSLDFLEEKGFVTYETKQSKRYKASITLSSKGVAVGRRITEKINYVLSEFCVGLNDEELREFYRCLNIVSDSLDKCANSTSPESKAQSRGETQ